MTMFAPIELIFRGETYKIPPGRVMGAIALVEEFITLSELATQAQEGRLRMVKLSQAFGAVLRYAGAEVTDEEVYTELYSGNADEARARIIASVNALMVLMVPPGTSLAGNGKAPADPPKSTGAAKPSRNSTKRWSAPTGLRGTHSGKRIP